MISTCIAMYACARDKTIPHLSINAKIPKAGDLVKYARSAMAKIFDFLLHFSAYTYIYKAVCCGICSISMLQARDVKTFYTTIIRVRV